MVEPIGEPTIRIARASSADLRVGSEVTFIDYDEIDVPNEDEIPAGVIVYNGVGSDNELIPIGGIVSVRLYDDYDYYNFRKEEAIRDIANPKDFVVNEYITLKFRNSKTHIYIKGKEFTQCKFLLLNLEPEKEYKEINSIDEAAEKLSTKMETNHSLIPAKTEFWGHCSNLQAWVENNYDPRIIHTNLGFPLLKELIKHGDKKAEIAFKEEIIYRIEEGGYNAFEMLKNNLKLFNTEEIELVKDIIRQNDVIVDKLIDIYIKKPFRMNDATLRVQPTVRYTEYEIAINRRQFSGGAGQDDDMRVSGDFLATIYNVIRMCREEGIMADLEIRIITDLETYMQSQTNNHFFTRVGITEFERVMNIPEVKEWLLSQMLEAIMVFQVYYIRDGIRRMDEYFTGRLTFG